MIPRWAGRVLKRTLGWWTGALDAWDRAAAIEKRLFGEEPGTIETGLLTRGELVSLSGRVVFGPSTRGHYVCRAIDPSEKWPPAVLPAATAPWTVDEVRIQITPRGA